MADIMCELEPASLKLEPCLFQADYLQCCPQTGSLVETYAGRQQCVCLLF